MTPLTHTPDNCNCPYEQEPKYISRAKWVCPTCNRDVSMEYVLLKQLLDKK